MSFCLPLEKAQKFIDALKSDKINPEKLSEMNSVERREFFKKIVGEENAQQVNTLFESKLLLKNQQQGMINWAKQVSGIKEPVRRDLLNRINKLEKVLDAKDKDLFLEDLASSRLGIDVTFEQAQKLVNSAKSLESKKSAIKDNSKIRSSERMDYGTEFALFKQFVEDLKISNDSPTIKEYLTSPKKLIMDVSGTTKSIVASLDNSFFFRQGIKTLATNPDIWAKSFLKSWGDIARELKGVDAMIPIRADIYSRPNALNGKYINGKFALGLAKEEAFPTSIPSKIPILGRLYTASESAYNGAALRMRADLADRVISKAEKMGRDTSSPEEMRSLGKLVNSLTGRGDIGKLEVVGQEINAAIFSIKFLKSNFDTLTAHLLDTKMTGYAKVEAAKNLLKIIGVTAAVLGTAKMLYPDSVDFDPRSSNFGKIRIEDTRFDISGGMGSIITLASRIVPTVHNGKWGWYYKSSTTDRFTRLGADKYGAKTPIEILYSFGEGKTSPLTHTLINILRQKDFQGEVPTATSELKNLTVPFSISNFYQMRDNPASAPILMGMIAEALGVGVNTYSRSK